MNKYILLNRCKYLIILLVILNQNFLVLFAKEGVSKFITHSGVFFIHTPPIELPKFSQVPLMNIGPLSLPTLPRWKNSLFIPEDPSWLDQSGKIYKEGINAYFTGKNELAIDCFRQIEEFHQETPWFIPSMFWIGQLLAQQGHYNASAKKLNAFEVKSKTSPYPFRSDFLYRSHYVKTWIELKQNRFDFQSLEDLKKELEHIADSQMRFIITELIVIALEKQNNFKKTLQMLYRLQKEYPNNLEVIIRLSEFYYRNQKWESISDLVETHLSNRPLLRVQLLEKLLMMGIHAEIQQGRLFEAKSWVNLLQEVSKGNPDLPTLASIRVHQLLNDYSKIKATWERIEDPKLRNLTLRELFRTAYAEGNYKFLVQFEFDPVFWRGWQAEGHLIRAQSFRNLEQRKNAYESYQYAYQEAKNEPLIQEMALFQKTLIELESKDLQSAQNHLQQLLEVYPESKRQNEFYFLYGLVLHKSRSNSTASLMALRQIEEDDDRADDSLYLRGRIHIESSNWNYASKVLEHFKTNHPGSVYFEEGLYFLALALYKQKQYNKAQSILSALRQQFPDLKNPSLVIHLQARNLMALEDYENAHKILQKELQHYTDFSLIQLHLLVLEQLKDQHGILEMTQIGLNLSTTENQSYLHFHRANALFKTKRFLKSYVHYEQALLNPPVEQELFIKYRLVKIHFLLREYKDFESSAEKFLEKHKDNNYTNELLQMLGNHYALKNLDEKAFSSRKRLIKNLENSVRSDQTKPIKRLELVSDIGKLYNLIGDYSSAEQWLTQALKLIKNSPDGKKKFHLKILRQKGLAAFKLGKPARALSADLKVKYLDKTLSLNQSYELNLRIAESYHKLKKYREAQTIYKSMLKEFKEKKFQNEIKKFLKKMEKEAV